MTREIKSEVQDRNTQAIIEHALRLFSWYGQECNNVKAAGEDAKVVLATFASQHEQNDNDLDDRFMEHFEKVQTEFMRKHNDAEMQPLDLTTLSTKQKGDLRAYIIRSEAQLKFFEEDTKASQVLSHFCFACLLPVKSYNFFSP